jgi:hypothetical protein
MLCKDICICIIGFSNSAKVFLWTAVSLTKLSMVHLQNTLYSGPRYTLSLILLPVWYSVSLTPLSNTLCRISLRIRSHIRKGFTHVSMGQGKLFDEKKPNVPN